MIYDTTDKSKVDISKIILTSVDFQSALKAIVPTTWRSDCSEARAIPAHMHPLFLPSLKDLLGHIDFIFSPSWKAVKVADSHIEALLKTEAALVRDIDKRLEECRRNLVDGTKYFKSKVVYTSVKSWGKVPLQNQSSKHYDFKKNLKVQNTERENDKNIFQLSNMDEVFSGTPPISEGRSTSIALVSSDSHVPPVLCYPRLVLCGQADMGQSSHLGPALIHALEDLPVYMMNPQTMFSSTTGCPEQACIQVSKG